MTIIADRANTLDTIQLLSGGHDPNDDGRMCLMEAVAYITGEPVVRPAQVRIPDPWRVLFDRMIDPSAVAA